MKSKPYPPKGPRLESKEYKKSPTTTVGKDINVCRTVVRNSLPLNFPVPTHIPKGKAKIVAKKVDIKEILRTSNVLSIENVLRNDQVISSLDVKDVLKNATAKAENFFKGPKKTE